MTIIAIRNGVMAADARVTVDSEGAGTRVFQCQKLYTIPEMGVVIGVHGESFSGLRFVDWYRSIPKRKKGAKKRDIELVLGEAEFGALVLHKDGKLEAFDKWLVPEDITLKEGEFYAEGSGTKLALGAMEMGADAVKAAEIACKYDPFCALPIVKVDIKDL